MPVGDILILFTDLSYFFINVLCVVVQGVGSHPQLFVVFDTMKGNVFRYSCSLSLFVIIIDELTLFDVLFDSVVSIHLDIH